MQLEPEYEVLAVKAEPASTENCTCKFFSLTETFNHEDEIGVFYLHSD